MGSSRIRDWTCVSCIGRQILSHWATREAHEHLFLKVQRGVFFKHWACWVNGAGLSGELPLNWTNAEPLGGSKPCMDSGECAAHAHSQDEGLLWMLPECCPELDALHDGCWQAHVWEQARAWKIPGCSERCWKVVRLQQRWNLRFRFPAESKGRRQEYWGEEVRQWEPESDTWGVWGGVGGGGETAWEQR